MESIDYLDKGYVKFDPASVSVLDCLTSVENLEKYVTDLAAISRGKDKSNNPALRFKGLCGECSPYGDIVRLKNGELPLEPRGSRPLEFVPICVRVRVYGNIIEGVSNRSYNIYNVYDEYVGEIPMERFYNELIRHGHVYTINRTGGYEEFIIYTNLRTLINLKVNYKAFIGCKYNKYRDQKYMILKIKAPMFVWAQIMTHTQLSKESQSDRVTEGEKDYYLPKEFYRSLFDNQDVYEKHKEDLKDIDFTKEDLEETEREILIKFLLNKLSANDCKNLFKELGFKKEIYNRAMYYLQYKEFVVGGYIDNINGIDGWTNLIKERTNIELEKNDKLIHKHWTQKETNQLCEIIHKFYNRFL